jgi:hypothetical protein
MLTIEDVRRLRLAAQGLSPGLGLGPAEVAERAVALQGQDLPAVLHAIALRAGVDVPAVRAAFDTGDLVRSWPMRGTLFATTPAWLATLLSLTAERIENEMARRRGDLGLDDAAVERSWAVAAERIADGPVTRAEMLALWEAAGLRGAAGPGYHLIVLHAIRGRWHWGPFIDGDNKHTGVLASRADWRSEAGHLWELHAGWANGRRQHGGHNQLLRPPHKIYSQNGYAQARWRSGDDPRDHHALNAFWTLDTWDQTYFSRPVPQLGGLQGLWELSVRGERAEFEYQRTLAPHDTLRSAWGVAARLDRMQAPGYLGRPDTMSHTLHRAFTHHEWRMTPDLVGNLGLMLEHHSDAGNELSPRVALNWQFQPGHVMRVSASRATRTPSIVEEYADHELSFGPVADQLLLSSGGLRAERIRSSSGSMSCVRRRHSSSVGRSPSQSCTTR